MDNSPLLLLVEDEPIIRTSLAAALEDGGYRLIEADDAAQAMDVIEGDEQLSGIITDVQLGPGKNGWDIARHARHRFPNLAVVYMTGDSSADWGAEGVPNSTLLQKPFATAQMVTAVSMLLNVADISQTQHSPADE